MNSYAIGSSKKIVRRLTRVVVLMRVLLTLLVRVVLILRLLRIWRHSLVTVLVDLVVADVGLHRHVESVSVLGWGLQSRERDASLQ